MILAAAVAFILLAGVAVLAVLGLIAAIALAIRATRRPALLAPPLTFTNGHSPRP